MKMMCKGLGETTNFDCVKLIGQAWNDSSTRLMNGRWKNLYPESVQQAFEECNIKSTHREIVDLAKTSGYQTILNGKLREGKQTTPDFFF
jgi:hypothetical protein